MAEDNSRTLSALTIVKPALAYYIPDYTVKSDNHGNFSFNVPNTKSTNWRIFAVTDYSQGATSPKSNTLKLEIVSSTSMFLKNVWEMLLSLLTLPTMIILEIVVILLIITAAYLNKKRTKTKKMYLNDNNPINEYLNYLRSRRPY